MKGGNSAGASWTWVHHVMTSGAGAEFQIYFTRSVSS